MGAWVDDAGMFRTYKHGDGAKVLRDGAGEVVGFSDRDSAAVLAIEIELSFAGLLDVNKVDGYFAWRTRRAVKQFQAEEGLTADGQVGPITAQYLFLHRVDETERALGIADHLLFGLLYWESRFDPGVIAVNPDGSLDRYLAQINDTAHPEVSEVDAADPTYSIPYAGLRMKKAYDWYVKTCEPRAWDCAVLQHNTPLGASKYCAEGVWATEKNRLYVESVRTAASKFPLS